ncbi:MAG TPA: hypothetical protein VG842_01805 [Sediminibacterium sp.]|nr:hypothetical protein [Sediminibacterium sp.]
MVSIVDKSGKTVAFLYQNMILDLSQQRVIGLVLGNCLFGVQTGPVGKFFNDTFRKKNGKIIARLSAETVPLQSPKDAKLMQQAWKILNHVEDHVCWWVEEKKAWTKQSFTELLLAEKEVPEEV